MKFKSNFAAFIIISLLGTIGHFLFEWSGNNFFVGLFSPTNESIWEHLKLLFYPAIIFFAICGITDKNKPQNFLTSTIFSIFCGMLYIVAIYYTLKGIIGKDVEFINISIYYIAVIITLCKRKKFLSNEKFTSKNAKAIALGLAFLMAFLFAVWSYNPPQLGIFNIPQ